uniref:Peptidase S33 tripeptidyl aminopeptidase-like C-terminal domain-containing protein n=1 Tax=Globisporangium ultimum (strain ATCC 200006 / CBS 805.95 / DAOM BR144) TaxID=431595 RepID=K3XAS2_GLOUD
MRVQFATALALSVGGARAQTNAASLSNATSSSAVTASNLNGWYACTEFTFADDADGETLKDAECAVYTAPLCYAGICTDAKDRTVEVFVKRIPAVDDADSMPNVWFLQGGPGAGSTAMESAMISFREQMNGKVNVYTMDHRGTGRSTLLNCLAAQATTSGSPSGSDIDVTEVPDCAKDLETKYGSDMAAFSTTTAATDLSTFISTYQGSTGKTFVYGVSYGTALVERLMHLKNPDISGYILDGIATSSGSDVKNFEYFSTWDADFGEVGDYYMTFCTKDATCAARFPTTSLADTLQNIIDSFDSKPDSTCAALVRDVTSGEPGTAIEPASYTLRRSLGSLFQSESTRSLIPVLAYRLNRCNKADTAVLTHYFNVSTSALSPTYEDSAFESTLLYYLIVFSEMWESPQSSIPVMLKRFTDAIICNGGSSGTVPTYCAFSKEQSTTCNALDVGSYSASPLVYKKDEYWNVAAEIPDDTSVLLMSSKMDPQTPHKYAEYLLAALNGTAKELITFEHATHGTLWTTPQDDEDKTITCGMEILLSYVRNEGDLSRLDKSCVATMPAISFEVDEDIAAELLSTSDAFDGMFDASLSSSSSGGGASGTSSSSSGTSYKTAFVVFLVLFLLALIGLVAFAFRWYRRRQRRVQEQEAAKANSGSGQSTGLDNVVVDSSPTTVFQPNNV